MNSQCLIETIAFRYVANVRVEFETMVDVGTILLVLEVTTRLIGMKDSWDSGELTLAVLTQGNFAAFRTHRPILSVMSGE